MFVASHKRHKWGKRTPKLIMFIGTRNGGEKHYIGNDGECDWMGNMALENWYTPITLPCPHCNAQIQQAERVSCECGAVYRAIDEESVKYLTKLLYDSYDTNFNEFIHHINSLHWLEITAGVK